MEPLTRDPLSKSTMSRASAAARAQRGEGSLPGAQEGRNAAGRRTECDVVAWDEVEVGLGPAHGDHAGALLRANGDVRVRVVGDEERLLVELSLRRRSTPLHLTQLGLQVLHLPAEGVPFLLAGQRLECLGELVPLCATAGGEGPVV